ncbi:SGNH/GDSL hydrolase family protein [Streptomyces zagrosensis]|uniref:Lysophospholipase L1-like esterase n=1 Tax=Streptomyces zagrosensis TaxID=1042984 RepID=A0A7W9Q7I3_9ACTN|nr:SGNH/GDSL hydrolase family protein [Streptomyces zagrosensis]MBB5934152.1 lysophospholipase L1-like esterase [Streptomyces zagrosensis]
MPSAPLRLATSLVALTAVLAASGAVSAHSRTGTTDGTAAGASTFADASDTDRHRAKTNWSAGWAAPVQRPSTGFEENWAETGFAHQTVRQVVRVTGSGTAARIKLSNRYGDQPLKISGATIARSAGGASVRPHTVRKLTFGDRSTVTIPAGGQRASDAAPLGVEQFDSVTVTLYFAEPTGPATFHSQAYAKSYRAEGDHRKDRADYAFSAHTNSWYYLSDVELSSRPAGAAGGASGPSGNGSKDGDGAKAGRRDTVVAFGDSITDGYGSTGDANNRYPDQLAERLAAAGTPRPVLNSGIGGNLLLNDSAWYGDRAADRFDRDVLDKPGVRSVIVFEGLNDIGFSEVDLPTYKPNPQLSADDLIAGYRELITRAHARGVRVVGATILPFKGAEYHTPRAEQKRQQINEWIRTSGEFDAYADFAKAVESPGDSLALNPAYDSGDHKHPNDAGYKAMAAAIDLDTI